ncbi:chaplin [Streptomyces pacificus]|uniref:chaplin n=1 Tax=Streptomyces pacificus TaxID=2705029 RepID=UPI003530F85B
MACQGTSSQSPGRRPERGPDEVRKDHDGADGTADGRRTASSAVAESGATGGAATSPGVLSGNTIRIPVHAPMNTCGHSVNLIAVLHPAFGNLCVNG